MSHSDTPKTAAASADRAAAAPGVGNLGSGQQAGCLVIECDLEEAKIDGVTYRIAGLPPIIFLNQNQPAHRMRFSLAHELGHIVVHAYPSVPMEDEANRFASAFLMPALDIGPELKGLTIDKAAYMKPVWRSLQGGVFMATDVHARRAAVKKLQAGLYSD